MNQSKLKLTTPTLVENMVKKNRSHFPIAVLLTTLICSHYTTADLIFDLTTQILRIWGLLIYRWKGLENTFPTVYYMPPEFQSFNRKTKKTIMQSFSDCRS
jgi:hypothetical protein